MILCSILLKLAGGIVIFSVVTIGAATLLSGFLGIASEQEDNDDE